MDLHSNCNGQGWVLLTFDEWLFELKELGIGMHGCDLSPSSESGQERKVKL